MILSHVVQYTWEIQLETSVLKKLVKGAALFCSFMLYND